MSTTKMRTNGKRLVVVGAAVGAVTVLSGLIAAPNAEKPSSDQRQQVEDLLNERIKVLEQIVNLQQAAYQRGGAGIDEVLSAQIDVFVARLELAKTRQERIALRRNLAEAAKVLEAAAKQRFEHRAGTEQDYLKAKALRLRAQADLLRERAGETQ